MRWLWLLLGLTLLSCSPREKQVDAREYESFWLWAGVTPQPAIRNAKTLYLLDGELVGSPTRFIPLRPGVPRLPGKSLWLVVRTDTLAWPAGAAEALAAKLDRWAAQGNQVEGLQVDFDARTRGLHNYAAFLAKLRQQLPNRYRLSITGLMDWSANGDPKALATLAPIVDEAVIQTYQGRSTIPGYHSYFRGLSQFPIPFKVGLVQNGNWQEPVGLAANPRFEGYVVFLLEPS